MFCFVVVVVAVVVVDSKNGMDPPCMGASYCVGGAEGWEERNKEAKKAGWGLARPGRPGWAGRGGGGRVAETEREIKTERLIDRQTEKEGDREICSSS